MLKSFKSLTARLRAILSEDEFSPTEENYSSSSIKSLSNRLWQIVFPQLQNFSAKRKHRSSKNKNPNRKFNRKFDWHHPIVAWKDLTVSSNNPKIEITIKEGTVFSHVQSFAQGLGIDTVMEKIKEAQNKYNKQTEPKDWFKLKGYATTWYNNKSKDSEIHFYYCRGIGYLDFKKVGSD